ncbi:MAG: OadG family protein [Bacteroidales bacterium]|nr:OadG family protein [Bacteroidales bacterium]
MMTLVLLDVASKAARMAEQDPNGWIMTLVAVCVVFLTLFLLQYCYRFVGWLSTREKGTGAKKAARTVGKRSADGRGGADWLGGSADGEVAAAIATALSMETSGEIQAVIGLALDRWFSESIHDKESYVITIKRKY